MSSLMIRQEVVTLSGFDPIRRDAQDGWKTCSADGRITQLRIEELVGKNRQEIDNRIFVNMAASSSAALHLTTQT